MKNISAIALVASLFSLGLNAQEFKRCATQDVFMENARKYPGYAEAVEQAFLNAKSYAGAKGNHAANKTTAPDTIYRIPVVVHIVYNKPWQNLPDSLVYSQIEVMNEDYRRLNADTGDTRAIFKSRAGDAGIEFFLAETDPDGNPTTGITRDQTSRVSFGDNGTQGLDNIKLPAQGGVEAWDVDHYLNIWVGNLIDSNNLLYAVLGLAYPPAGAPNWPANSSAAQPGLQGVMVHYQVFGRNNPMAVGELLGIADRGRTAVHETGHYLGLRHIWGDGTPLSIDCSKDDGIEDTPNAGVSSQFNLILNFSTFQFDTIYACDPTKNTCVEASGPDYPDMYENYMDYSEERCQNMFTQQQIDIMRAMLATARAELPEIVVPGTSGISNPSADDLGVNIYPNPAKDNLTISFQPSALKDGEISILNVVGKEIYRSSTVSEINKIDLTAFASGIYLVKIKANDKTATQKLIMN